MLTHVEVTYVNGEQRTGPPELWATWPGEGVDRVTGFNSTGFVQVASASLYWLYREDGYWVLGTGSVRYDPNPLTEIVWVDSGQLERQVRFMPDLLLRYVKLGHWWPGTSEPVDG